MELKVLNLAIPAATMLYGVSLLLFHRPDREWWAIMGCAGALFVFGAWRMWG